MTIDDKHDIVKATARIEHKTYKLYEATSNAHREFRNKRLSNVAAIDFLFDSFKDLILMVKELTE